MSDSQTIKGIVLKYLFQWFIGFGLLYWWIKEDPDKQWYWWVAISIFLLGLILMVTVKKIGDKAANTLSKKLIEKISSDTSDKADK